MLNKRIISLLLCAVLLLGLCACSQEDIELAGDIVDIVVDVMESEDTQDTQPLPSEEPVVEGESSADDEPQLPAIDERGSYTSREDVALYIYTYGHLPDNFITKSQARELGWEGGGLEEFAPGCCIGGDRFGNREGLLPEAEGRFYTECDIDTLGADSRGAKRIVFSNDGLIYYTDDHYESFELLYGEE